MGRSDRFYNIMQRIDFEAFYSKLRAVGYEHNGGLRIIGMDAAGQFNNRHRAVIIAKKNKSYFSGL